MDGSLVDRPGGRRRPRLDGECTRDEQGNITRFYGANQDITERKNAEIALRESKQRYEQILDAITDMVLVKGEKSRIVWANKSFRDYYGMSNEQLRDMIDAPTVEPDYTLQYIKDDAYVFETGNILSIPEEPVTRFDGQVFPFETVKAPIRDINGRVVMTVGVSRDITERKKNQEIMEQRARELEEAQTFLDSVIENLPTMLFVKDAEELRFVRWNRAAEELSGLKREDLIGRNDYDFFPKEEADFFTSKDRQVLAEGQLTDIPEEPLATVHQGTRYLHTRKAPILGADWKAKYLLGVSLRRKRFRRRSPSNFPFNIKV